MKQERAIQVRKHGVAQSTLLYRGAMYRLVTADEDDEFPPGTKRQRRRVLIESLVRDIDILSQLAESTSKILESSQVEEGGWQCFNPQGIDVCVKHGVGIYLDKGQLRHTLLLLFEKIKELSSSAGKLTAGV